MKTVVVTFSPDFSLEDEATLVQLLDDNDLVEGDDFTFNYSHQDDPAISIEVIDFPRIISLCSRYEDRQEDCVEL